ncbi:MAG: ATP synthase F1 subunit epsilon [bacterium TMED217]|nr:MAG: ATP synthase F1 subunit epsilon [bacterium TMED217]
MEAFSVEIVTPIKILNQESVKYIRCPGIDGSFGIMKKHREGVFALDIGEIKIETNSETEWYSTSGGFVEIGSDKVELLLESVEKSNEIDVKRATEALERAKNRKSNPQEKIDSTRLEASLTRAMNRLRVSKK